jgi:hypothetical protein
MRIAIVYDSIFGNTGEIAKAIATVAGTHGEVTLLAVADARALDPAGFDLLLVGSPTRGFAPTPAIAEFVGGLPRGAGRAAAFDTRLDPDNIHPAPLRWVVQVGGYAADRIASSLREKGFALYAPNGDFVVTGTEGPLKPGEIARAEAWAKAVLEG